MRPADAVKNTLHLNSQALFAFAVILSVIPIWIPEFLPFVDIPQQTAQVASLHGLLGDNAYLDESLEINWFTPYLGGYLFLFFTSAILPILPALKLVISVAVAAVPVLTGVILREIGGDERLKWLAIPCGYSFALYWGFMNYIVATPIALALILLTIRFERNPTTPRALAMGAFSIGLLFCHVIALGFGALMSLTYIAAKNFKSPLRLARCWLPYTAPLPFIAIWLYGVYQTEDSVQGSPIIFAPASQRLRVLFEQFAGLDGSMFALGLLVSAAVVVLPFLFGYRPSPKIERWLPFVVGLIVYMIFPYYMQSTAFLYQRLGVFLIPLWLILWDAPRHSNPLFGASCIAVAAIWVTANFNRFVDFAAETRGFSAILQEIAPQQLLGGMMFCNATESFRYPVYLHYHAWYQALSGGIADNSFALTHPSLIRYQDLHAPRLNDDLVWTPQAFQWERDGGSNYDYFIVCGAGDFSEALFKDSDESIELVAHEHPWWLYQNVERRNHQANGN